jgi:hypothetical protein
MGTKEQRTLRERFALFAAVFFSLAPLWGCAGSYEETISGVTVPVPKAMAKSTDKPAEMSILGFGAGQATYHGDLPIEKIVEFYKKELPARGWQPNMNLRSGGAMLAYSKNGKSLLINAGKENGKTILSLTVMGVGK